MKRLKLIIIAIIAMVTVASSGAQEAAAAYKSNMPWSSGAFAEHSARKLTSWAVWRGRSADNIAVFPTPDNWGSLHSTWWYSSLPSSFDHKRQDLVVAVPLYPHSNSLANTGTDAQWRTLADTIEAKDPNAWVRLGWEMNLNASHWKITNANRDQWAAAFNRAVDQMKIAAPKLRFVFNPNRGPDQTCNAPAQNACTRYVFHKVKSRVQAYGLDSYDSFPALRNSAAYRQHFTDYGGLQESANFAKQQGKKFVLPEWGIACNQNRPKTNDRCQWIGNAGGDNALYIQHYMNFLWTNRQNIGFETYFEDSSSYIRSALNPKSSPIGPQSPAMYKNKLKQFGN